MTPCTSCGASNPDTAAFCGMCYERFAGPVSTPSPAPGDAARPAGGASRARDGAQPSWDTGDWGAAAAPDASPTARGRDDIDGVLGFLEEVGARPDDGPVAPVAPVGGPGDRVGGPADGGAAGPRADAQPQREVAVGRFVSSDGETRWRCVVCETTNPLTDFRCTVCGSSIDTETDVDASIDWVAARRAETLIPGWGHWKADRGGVAVARSSLVGIWLLGVLALGLQGTAGLLTGLPFLIGIAIIWVTGPGDLDAARVGREPRLNGRGLTYVVVGVVLGVIVTGGLSLALG